MRKIKAKQQSDEPAIDRQEFVCVAGDTITIRVKGFEAAGHGRRVLIEVVAASGPKPLASEQTAAG